jgi:spore coat protein H
MKYALCLSLCTIICTAAFAQLPDLRLELPDTFSIEKKDVFSLKINSFCESKLKEITDEKLQIYPFDLTYNGDSLNAESCKTRGKSTHLFRRKSFSISLEDPIVLGKTKIKKLALNNLVMDQNYYRNRLSFLLMERLGIFHLHNQFTEMQINGKSNGLYLAIQKPDDYIRSLESKLLVRREYGGHFTIEDTHDKDAKDQIKRLRNIRKLTKTIEGQQLYNSLNAVVDMDHYFKWLAFNYIIKNGDYTDELFLYLRMDEDRFDIIPWDYDDIFMRQPHDGFVERNKVLGHKLIFSGEAYIDIIIDSDDFLYLEFLRRFTEVLEILNPDCLKAAFEKVYLELYPYYVDQDIIAQSVYDQYGLTDLSTLRTDLRNKFQDILNRRLSIEVVIASELKRLSE